MSKWLRRTLKGLGNLVGVLVVMIIGLMVYVQFTWDRPVNREVREMTAPTDAGTAARA